MCALAGSSRIIAIIISNKNFLKQVSSIMGKMERGVEKEARDFGGLLNFMYFNAF